MIGMEYLTSLSPLVLLLFVYQWLWCSFLEDLLRGAYNSGAAPRSRVSLLLLHHSRVRAARIPFYFCACCGSDRGRSFVYLLRIHCLLPGHHLPSLGEKVFQLTISLFPHFLPLLSTTTTTPSTRSHRQVSDRFHLTLVIFIVPYPLSNPQFQLYVRLQDASLHSPRWPRCFRRCGSGPVCQHGCCLHCHSHQLRPGGQLLCRSFHH
jgi:hypothetical protein